MTEPACPDGCNRARRDWITGTLLASWLMTIAALWTGFALAPIGALAAANAGRLVAIQGSTVITTHGYFHVSTAPSAVLGVPLQVIRTNSLWSDTGLQLCASRSTGDDYYWCSDISGYAGDLSETSLAERAWSHGAMAALLLVAISFTIFGWSPAVAVACGGRAWTDDDESRPAAESGNP